MRRPDTHVWRGPLLDSLGPGLYALLTADGLVKIGFSTALGSRIRSYGANARLLAIKLCATIQDETALHGLLAQHAVRGREWYPVVDEVLAVVNDMRADIGLPPLYSHELLAA